MKKSFTLIECLVALSLMSLIALALIPSVYNSIVTSKKQDDNYKIILEMQDVIESYKTEHFNDIEHKTYKDFLIKEELFDSYKKVNFTYDKDNMDLEVSLLLPNDISRYKGTDGEKEND